MPIEMEFNERLHEGDLVLVKSKSEIDDLKDNHGDLPWVSQDGGMKSSLYFGSCMYKYCGIPLEVDYTCSSIRDGGDFIYYRLRLPANTEIEYLEDEDGTQYGRKEISTDLKTWSWILSMLNWPDGEITEEIAGVDADSLFEILLS